MARSVRVFAVGWKMPAVHLMRTERDFQKEMKSILSKGVLGKQGPGDNIVVFPEYLSLLPSVLGPKGEKARLAENLQEASLAIHDSYSEACRDIGQRCQITHPGQLVTLALTHTVWNCLERTFTELAAQYQLNLVIAATLPGRMRRTEDPKLIAAYNPYPNSLAPVWIPDERSPQPGNFSILFRPDRTHSFVRKVHLTAEEKASGLIEGRLQDVSSFRLARGTRLGIATCFDAFFSDYLDKLAEQRVEILAIPSAGASGWATYETAPDYRWQPLAWLDAVIKPFSHYPTLRGIVNSMLRGKAWDLSFDGQISITIPAKGKPSPTFIASEDQVYPGRFAYLGKWGRAPELRLGSLSERRERLSQLTANPRYSTRATEVGRADIELS